MYPVRFLIPIILITLPLPLLAQTGYISTIKFQDSVAVGDTALVDHHQLVNVPYWPGCCSFQVSLITKDTELSIYYVPQNGGGDPAYDIYFHPSYLGQRRDSSQATIDCPYNSHGGCIDLGSLNRYTVDTIFSISDSFPKIRPLMWSITMKPDSQNKAWTNHSFPTFDNPIPDTTLFSNFSAKQTSGESVSLQVFDSITPITEYRELPYTRKHPLNLIFSSPNYQSFNTVIFSTRMQHGTVDSTISYALPVTWQAPSSVSNPSGGEVSYSLPNPFTNHISIGFSLDKAEDVKAALFDITGSQIRIDEREFDAGTREITFDTHDLPSGSYFYVLRGAEWNRSGKLVKLSEP